MIILEKSSCLETATHEVQDKIDITPRGMMELAMRDSKATADDHGISALELRRPEPDAYVTGLN